MLNVPCSVTLLKAQVPEGNDGLGLETQRRLFLFLGLNVCWLLAQNKKLTTEQTQKINGR